MTQKTFLGIEIEGNITYAEHRASQRPKEELTPLVQALLDDEHVIEFGWSQYTPYFNDGEPCVFGAQPVWVRTDAPEDAGTGAGGYGHLSIESGHQTLQPCEWIEDPNSGYGHTGHYEDLPVGEWQRDLLAKSVALNSAIESGAFDDVLLETFGDHAEVTIRRDGIKVESYEHD
jgi:hypothetical protein